MTTAFFLPVRRASSPGSSIARTASPGASRSPWACCYDDDDDDGIPPPRAQGFFAGAWVIDKACCCYDDDYGVTPPRPQGFFASASWVIIVDGQDGLAGRLLPFLSSSRICS